MSPEIQADELLSPRSLSYIRMVLRASITAVLSVILGPLVSVLLYLVILIIAENGSEILEGIDDGVLAYYAIFISILLFGVVWISPSFAQFCLCLSSRYFSLKNAECGGKCDIAKEGMKIRSAGKIIRNTFTRYAFA